MGLKIAPEYTGTELIWSVAVVIVTLPPAVAEPVTSPVRVRVTVEFAAMIADVVTTMDVEAIRIADPDNPSIKRERSPEKNIAGSKIVIILPIGISPPTDVIKPMVA